VPIAAPLAAPQQRLELERSLGIRRWGRSNKLLYNDKGELCMRSDSRWIEFPESNAEAVRKYQEAGLAPREEDLI
jgi:hypothetical protein